MKRAYNTIALISLLAFFVFMNACEMQVSEELSVYSTLYPQSRMRILINSVEFDYPQYPTTARIKTGDTVVVYFDGNAIYTHNTKGLNYCTENDYAMSGLHIVETSTSIVINNKEVIKYD